MADQLNMGGLGLGPSAAEQQPPARSYIPPHMRGKMTAPNGGPNNPPPPMNGPPPPMNGLGNSAWSG